jgi:hypothetical protein
MSVGVMAYYKLTGVKEDQNASHCSKKKTAWCGLVVRVSKAKTDRNTER